jgi:HTH-type transcriptional regulator/antitoxin HigA
MRTTTKKQVAATTEGYLHLVRRFELRPLRTRGDYDRAVAVMRDLLDRSITGNLGADASDYLGVLVRLVRDYDEQHSSLLRNRRKPTPIEALKWLMEENGMNTIDLGKFVGGSGNASMILNGKRELSKANIRSLAERFKVSPALFL